VLVISASLAAAAPQAATAAVTAKAEVESASCCFGPLDRRARRIVRARRSLEMTVEFRDGNLNYGGKANYVLDPP
jgi:hypothetical protein